MKVSNKLDLHIYGTGTEEGYQTVFCSPGIEFFVREIESLCLRMGGEMRIELELQTQPLTLGVLSDGRAIVSLWRPSSVPDSRNRPNPMEAVSLICDYAYLAQLAFPLRQIREYLGTLTRDARVASQQNFYQETVGDPATEDLSRALRFSMTGEYASPLTFSPNSARWLGFVPSNYRHFTAIVGFEKFEATRDAGFSPDPLPDDFVEILEGRPYSAQLEFVQTWNLFYAGVLRQRQIAKRNRFIRNVLLYTFSLLALVGIAGTIFSFTMNERPAKMPREKPTQTVQK